MYYLKKIPWFIKKLFPNILWNVKGDGNSVFLSFDDGPSPGLTLWILEELKKHNAKASFFCTGKNIESFPEIFQAIIDGGHSVGNHGYEHISGWKSNAKKYLEDLEKAAKLIPSNLFRPPFGQITLRQYLAIRKKYQLVMWDLMPGDFEQDQDINKMYEYLIDKVEPGSIIALHDNKASETNIKQLLPLMLKFFNDKGFQMKSLV